jgi:hypothetical protein
VGLSAPVDDVAPVLFVEFVPDFSERSYRLDASNDRQLHPPPSSMSSSSMLGSTGSPCFRFLRYPSMASRMFSVASARV